MARVSEKSDASSFLCNRQGAEHAEAAAPWRCHAANWALAQGKLGKSASLDVVRSLGTTRQYKYSFACSTQTFGQIL